MTEIFDWNWHPSTKAEAESWPTYDSYHKRVNVAKSKFADESVIRSIATYKWGLNDHESQILAALAENPNLTPELTVWLDAQSANWGPLSQYRYWLTRYGVDQRNSNYTQDEEKKGPTRSFHPDILGKKLDCDSASRHLLGMADQFMEQMWHDLAIQSHIDLAYLNSFEGDIFAPIDLGDASEEIIRYFSPGYFATWVSKEESFDFSWARQRAEDDDGKWHFEEQTYLDHLWDENPWPASNLGMAIGAGVQEGDLEVIDETAYEEYLQEFHGDDREMYEVSVSITSDSPWVGVRYRDLAESQQMHLALNLLSTLEHPFLGRKDGLSRHLIDCLVKHDQTKESVKALLIKQLGN